VTVAASDPPFGLGIGGRRGCRSPARKWLMYTVGWMGECVGG
jgi:hypothetical protein